MRKRYDHSVRGDRDSDEAAYTIGDGSAPTTRGSGSTNETNDADWGYATADRKRS